MADKFSFERDSQQRPRLFSRIWHGRADGHYVPVVYQDISDGNAQVRAQLKTADASTAVDITAAPGANLKIVIEEIRVSAKVAVDLDIVCETTNAILATFYLPAGGNVTWRPPSPIKTATANKKLQAKAAASGAFAVDVTYHIEA